MNTIKAIIVPALVLAFASPEAGAQGNRVIEDGYVITRPKMFGELKGVVVLIREERFEQWKKEEEKNYKEYYKSRPNQVARIPMPRYVKWMADSRWGGNAQDRCFEEYGLKNSELEKIIEGRTDRKYDHEVTHLLFVCKAGGEE